MEEIKFAREDFTLLDQWNRWIYRSWCEEARLTVNKPIMVIEEHLMNGWISLEICLGRVKCFFQVVKSARVMKKAVAYLLPFIEQENWR